MFVEYRNWRPPDPPKPERPRPRLTRRQEDRILLMIGFNLALLLVAPIAGVTAFHAVWAWISN